MIEIKCPHCMWTFTIDEAGHADKAKLDAEALSTVEKERDALASELVLVKAQNIDITNFEQQIDDSKEAFDSNLLHLSDGFADALKQIDKAIKDLKKTKAALHKSGKNP